jgi:hypothetical protein
MTDFTIEGYQILQICAAEKKAFHKLNILNQLKSFSQFGGRGFDIGIAQQTLDELTTQGYIAYIEKIDSYKITEKGIDILEE